jgi:phage terminase small subunit
MPEKGGTGYHPGRNPHPECPECWGQGETRVIIKDTRSLSAGARMLFAGVKPTKHGPQVLLHSKLPALLKVGEQLGMWSDKLEAPKEESDLAKLLREISDRGHTLPVVYDDPERRLPNEEVQDAMPKPAQAAPGAVSRPKMQFRAVSVPPA